MGLTNDTMKEVKSDVVKKDQAERKDKHMDAHQIQIEAKLKILYDDIESIEAENSNINLAKIKVSFTFISGKYFRLTALVKH